MATQRWQVICHQCSSQSHPHHDFEPLDKAVVEYKKEIFHVSDELHKRAKSMAARQFSASTSVAEFESKIPEFNLTGSAMVGQKLVEAST